MATSFKALNNNDVTRAQTKLHEAIPITGTILSGTYGGFPAGTNIKNYSHGMFQSVYDYPYLSSSANHIIDLTAGFASNTALVGSKAIGMTLKNKKNDVYGELSQMLAGYDTTGSINKLDVSGNFSAASGPTRMNEVFVVNFARLLTKDEIQKQANGFTMTLGVSSSFQHAFRKTMNVYDINGPNAKTNSPAGEFNILFATSSHGSGRANNRPCGLIFYQAGIAVITSSVFKSDFVENCAMDAAGLNVDRLLVTGSISGSADALRHRIQNISFNNTTELNSSIYFCRANNSEFNYSSNPTYLSSSQIRVKTLSTDNPVSYVTSVGLYSEDNALLAVAKVSEPIKKTPAEEYTLRVRLDY